MSNFATGVVIVTTRLDGVDHAMTASSLTSVSLSPPLALVCVQRDLSFHRALSLAGEWGVSILDSTGEHLARRFSTPGRRLHDQLRGVSHHEARTVGAPLLSDALATLECRTVAVHPAGDHSIFIAQVESVVQDRLDRAALLHFGSAYAVGPRR
jgi:flavin reductase (DIM6/NTAB) family NADH-FMN oxidoreductase RutF